MAKVPIHPRNPERVCWGCDKLCPADDLRCGNGSIRAPHPVELFGDDWYDPSSDFPVIQEPVTISCPAGRESPGQARTPIPRLLT